MVLISSVSASDPTCNKAKWKLSKLEFSVSDPYLVTVLGFSYGPKVRDFIPKLSGAISRFYFEGDELNSKFNFFSTYYSNETDAQKAFEHMQIQVKGNKYQHVIRKDKQIIWFAGRNISEQCFQDTKKAELKRI